MQRSMRSSTRSDRDDGQAAVEFAVALPMVVVLVLGVVQVVIVGARQAEVERLARVGARAAAVAADPDAAARRAIGAATTRDPVEISVERSDGAVIVTVHVTDPTSVPVVGRVLGDVELSATAVMPREPP